MIWQLVMPMPMVLLALLSIVIDLATAHSWVEQFQILSSKGTFVGDYGYPRGYVARTDPTFTGFSMDYLLPALDTNRVRISSSDLLCHPAQRTSNYSSEYPRLAVNAGSMVGIKYLENGHVTLPDNQLGKPPAAGTVFVYGTTSPSSSEKIADVLAWTADGSGGNGAGVLLAAQTFDDGRCHQINSGEISTSRQAAFPDRVPGQPDSNLEQWCETDVKIPSTQQPGSLTVYWVWQWPTAPGADPTYPVGKDEYYTTCADFDIVAAPVDEAGAPMHTLAQQDPQTAADASFASRTALTSSPAVTLAVANSAGGFAYTGVAAGGDHAGTPAVSPVSAAATASAQGTLSTSRAPSAATATTTAVASAAVSAVTVRPLTSAITASPTIAASVSVATTAAAAGTSSAGDGTDAAMVTVTNTVTDVVTMTATVTSSPAAFASADTDTTTTQFQTTFVTMTGGVFRHAAVVVAEATPAAAVVEADDVVDEHLRRRARAAAGRRGHGHSARFGRWA